MSDPFYIGYEPRAPAAARRAVLRFLPVIALLLVASAVLLSRAQEFDRSAFEFGDVGSFEGVYRSTPVPLLVQDDKSVLLLVGSGKHGAVVDAPEGTRLLLKGTRIVRGSTIMVELVDGSVRELASARPLGLPVRLGPASLSGEIVGSKCFLGVMNPGRGPVHRACARHCILGSVPAMLYSRTESGTEERVLLTGLAPARLAAWTALPVTISGTRWSDGSLEWIEVESIEAGAS